MNHNDSAAPPPGLARIGRRATALALAASVVFAACSGDSSDPGAQQTVTSGSTVRTTDDTDVETTDVMTTNLSKVETNAATSAAPSSTNAPAPTQATTVTDPPVPTSAAPAPTGGSSIEDLIADARSVYGESTDAVAAIGAFIPVPAGIPTPEGATVFAFSARIDPAGTDQLVTSGDVTFQAPGTMDDLVTFFETSMTASGYTRTGLSEDTTTGREPLKTLEFAIPGSDYSAAAVEITIIGGAEARIVEIQIDDRPDQAAVAAAQQRLAAWAKTFPGRGPDVVDYQVSLSVQTVSGPYLVLRNAAYGTLPRAEQVAAIVAAVPDGTYTLDPETPPTEGEVTLVREGFDEIKAVVGEGGSLGTLVNVSAQLDL